MDDSKKENQALRLSDIVKEPNKKLPPIQGYETMELVTLKEAVKSLVSIVPGLDRMLSKIHDQCKSPFDNLSWEESASIMLYSLGWAPVENSFYMKLNAVLRNEDRSLLQPWFSYLKLLMTALSKLPSKNITVYRGVKCDLSTQYLKGEVIVWWGFSSCTTDRSVLESELQGGP